MNYNGVHWINKLYKNIHIITFIIVNDVDDYI